MPVQVRTEITSRSYDGGRPSFRRNNMTVEQDAGRGTADIVKFTVMAFNAASTKLIPLTVNTAQDGTQLPVGLITHTVPAADIVAGDVGGVELYTWMESANEKLIVLENSLTLADFIEVCSVTPIVAAITSDDATDLATAITLVNEIKTSLNVVSTAGDTSVIKSIRDYMEDNGIQIRRGEYFSQAENA